MKTASGNIESKVTDLEIMQKKLFRAESDKETCETKKNKLQNEANAEMDTLKKKIETLETELNKMKNSMLKESDKNGIQAAQQKEKLEKNINVLTKERDQAKISVARLEAEVKSLKADQVLDIAARGAVKGIGALNRLQTNVNKKMSPGQLPDVNPDAVSVIKKETNGEQEGKRRKAILCCQSESPNES